MSTAETPRWRKLALVVVMFLTTGSFGFLQPFVPLWLVASGVSRGQLGLITGVATATALLIQPLLGRLSDRLDTRRPLMVLAALVAWGAYLAFGAVRGFWPFLFLTILASNGFVYLNTVGGVLVGRLTTAASGGAGYARYRVWGSVGYVVIALGAGLLVQPKPGMSRADLAPIFALGPWIFLLIALASLLVPDPKRPLAPMRTRGERPTPARHPNLERYLLAYGLYSFALYGASGFLSLYMHQLGATPRQVTWMFAAGVVCEVAVMSQVGRWTDRHGRKPALALAFLLMPLRLLLYIPASLLGPAWVIGVQSLHGLNFGIVGAVSVVLVNDIAGETNRGVLQARLATTAGLASALGQLLCGWLSESYSIAVMFAAMSAIGFVAAILLLTRVEETCGSASLRSGRGSGR